MCEVVISPYGKALRDCRKALPITNCAPYHEKMTKAASTSLELAERLRAAVAATGMTRVDFAKACGVSKQAVQSWLTTGRIDKQKLLKFAEVSKVSVHSLLGAPDPSMVYSQTQSNGPVLLAERRAVMQQSTPWPFTAFSAQDYAALPPDVRSIAEGFITGLVAANHTKSTANNGTTGG